MSGLGSRLGATAADEVAIDLFVGCYSFNRVNRVAMRQEPCARSILKLDASARIMSGAAIALAGIAARYGAAGPVCLEQCDARPGPSECVCG